MVTYRTLAAVGFMVLLACTPAEHGLRQAFKVNLAYVSAAPLLLEGTLNGSEGHSLEALSVTITHDDLASNFWLSALLQVKVGNYKAAEETLDRMLGGDHNRVRLVHYLRGESRLAQGDEVGAIADWEQAGVAWPINRLAMQKVQEELWGEAAALLEVATQVAPEMSLPHRDLGWVLYEGRMDTDRAVHELAQAIRLAPQDTYAYRLITNVLLDAGRCQEAKMWSEELLQRLPRNVEALLVAGEVPYRCGELEVAEWYFNEVLAVAPETSAAYFRLGLIYTRQGLYDKAVGAYRRAIAIDPARDWYWSHLVATQLERGCTECAITDLLQAAELFPEKPEFSHLLSELQH